MDSFLEWSAQQHAGHPNTTKQYKTSSKPLTSFLGNFRVNAITPDEVERYKATRGTAQVKVRT